MATFRNKTEIISPQKEPGFSSKIGFRTYFIRGTIGVLALQLFATGLGFITNILLARFLGPTQYGIYTYVFSWLGLLTILSMFGFGNVIVREIVSYCATKRWSRVNGILRWVGTQTLVISFSIAIITTAALLYFRNYLEFGIFPVFLLAMLILPFITLSNMINYAMQGLMHIVLGKIPGTLIRMPLFIVSLMIFYFLSPQSLDAFSAIELYILPIFADVLFGLWLLFRSMPKQIILEQPEFNGGVWLRSAIPLLMVAGLSEINLQMPILMLGTMSGAKQTAIYAVAKRITDLISFFFLAVSIVLSPVISDLYTSGKMHRLQRFITHSVRISLSIASAVAFLIILSKHWVLLVFGHSFLQSGMAIVILSLGQILYVSAGSASFLLVMTGYEKDLLIAVGASTILTFTMNLLLIPRWGIEGAAITTVSGIILWVVILSIQSYRRLGIDPTIIGIRFGIKS